MPVLLPVPLIGTRYVTSEIRSLKTSSVLCLGSMVKPSKSKCSRKPPGSTTRRNPFANRFISNVLTKNPSWVNFRSSVKDSGLSDGFVPCSFIHGFYRIRRRKQGADICRLPYQCRSPPPPLATARNPTLLYQTPPCMIPAPMLKILPLG